jgi:single-stranded-DNA-specific exonuclease
MKYSLISEPNPNLTITQQILVNRGIPFEQINNYIKTTDASLHAPEQMDSIQVAVFLLLKHLKVGSKIYIQVDSDCDGYTSSAFLLNWIYRYSPESISNIEFGLHQGKEHGLSESFIDKLEVQQYGLVIVPDAGSNQLDLHEKLLDKNITCIVLDHHEAHERSKYAIVVNPQLDEYPNKQISGVGVVYKFCKILDSVLGLDIAEDMLDLVSLGMVADMVDIREIETKHLINKGLMNINNPFIKALCDKQAYSMRDGLTPISIGFYIAPLINAAIRVGTQEEKEAMFKAFLEFYAHKEEPSTKRGAKFGDIETVAEKAARQSTNIKNRQGKLRDEGMAKVNQIIQEQGLDNNKIIIVESPESLDKNLSGLIANQVMYKYQKPVLLLRSTKDGLLQGSGRGYDKSELVDLKGFLNNSNLVEYAEGHSNAFGAGIKADNIDYLVHYVNKELADFDFSPKYLVDFVFHANNLNLQDLMEIGNLKSLWGKGLDESFIVIRGLKITKDKLSLMSATQNPTLKIQEGQISFIKFKSSQSEYESLLSDEGFVEIDLVGKCSLNEWNGIISPQILIEEYQVVSSVAWYF